MKLEKLRKLPVLKGNIPALAISDFISSNGWSIFEVIWQPFVLSLGATVSILGGLSSINTVVGSGLQVMTGRFSDFIGRKSMQIVSFVFSIVAVTIEEAMFDLQEQGWLSYVAGGVFSKVKKTKHQRYYV